MSNAIPHFKFRYMDVSGSRTLCIEADGKVFHEILNLDDFYRVFGYRTNQAQSPDLLPDEFIWSEYVNSPAGDLSSCIQMHIVEYLQVHSDTFNKKFGETSKQWLADHAQIRAKRGFCCIACKLKSEKNSRHHTQVGSFQNKSAK